jgi:ankyrin repeat protein
LLGIAQERQEYALRLFQCLAESIRPLRAEELAEILAIQFDTGTLPNYDVNWRPEDPEEAVLSACSSLITIVDMDSSRVVQFSHFSVKEYLSSERLANAGKHLSQYHILPHSSHTILAQASLSVLLALDDQIDKERMKDFPFAIYAARYWVDHAQFDNVPSSIEVAMERLFDPAEPHFSAWVWIYDIDYRFRDIMFEARPTPPKAVPLYYATLCGFRDLVEHLIATYPRDVNARGGHHATPLHTAVVKGNVDVMKLLLEHGAHVASVDRNECTPLYEASQRGRLDIVSLLLDHGADVNYQDKYGWTALLEASFEGELEVAQILLQHGATADIGNTDGSTPLISASRHGHPDVVRLLLQSGATVDLPDNNGLTPLMSASRYGHPDVVLSLLQSGAAVDLQDNNGLTPLSAASRYGHQDVVHLLLQNGANVGSRSNDGRDSLMLASVDGHLDVVCLLLKDGASVDSRDNDGWTPLAIASENGYLDIVRLLLQRGAVVDFSPNDGRSPSSGTSPFPSRRCAEASSSPHRFKSRAPIFLYSSSSGVR